jgi:excisionase family DNA binding protein
LRDVELRLRAFPGIGQKKSSMAINILSRDLGWLRPAGNELRFVDVSYDVHVRRVFLESGSLRRTVSRPLLKRGAAGRQNTRASWTSGPWQLVVPERFSYTLLVSHGRTSTLIRSPDRRQGVTPEERWVGIEDVAAHLAVAKESIYRWVESRRFPAHRVGRLLRFKLSEVDEWVTAGGRNDSGPGSSRKSGRRKTTRPGSKKSRHA